MFERPTDNRNFPNGVPEDLIEAFKIDNGMEESNSLNEYFEDAGGGIWHETNIEDAINEMGILEILDLQKIADQPLEYTKEMEDADYEKLLCRIEDCIK